MTLVDEELQRALVHLRSGGVVAIATETFYSLCADARRPSAIEAVFTLKNREETRASALLVPDEHVWASYVREIPPLARRLATRFWPGQLTIALDGNEDVHPLLKYRGKVAVRIPGASPALELVRAFGGALTATSANPSGAPSSRTAEEVRAYFSGRAELMLVDRGAPGGLPSTVVEVSDNSWRVLRAGALPASVLDGAVSVDAAE